MLIRKGLSFCRQHGLRAFLARVVEKLGVRAASAIQSESIVEFYDFVTLEKIGTSLSSVDDIPANNTVTWVVPAFGYGSGGHLNIFRFVHLLEQRGFTCNIVVVGVADNGQSGDLRKQICDWFFPIRGDVYLNLDKAPPAFTTFATSWQTAYYVKAYMSTIHKCYFVQDFEPYFYALGSEYVWAEETYRFGFYGVTAGSWLEKKLSNEYGMTTSSVGFSYDRELYGRGELLADRRKPRVFFYARPPTQRRAFELGVMTFSQLSKRLPGVEIVFAGWDVSAFDIPFKYTNLGTLPLDKLKDVYHSCDAALVLSLTNLSLLPLELMASGVPVVTNCGENAQWLLNDENAKISKPTVEALSEALFEVLTDKELNSRLTENGIKFAESTSWEAEGDKLAAVLQSFD